MNTPREQFTVLGASGYIGRHLCNCLERAGHRVYPIARADPLPSAKKPLGHVIYAIGVTADFRNRPLETAQAHICALIPLLRDAQFDSLLYLSSTRIYAGATSTCEESSLAVSPVEPDHLYNLSKLAGESLALHSGRDNVRIARLSNVIGREFDSPNFLDSLVRDAMNKQEIILRSHPDSSKDYVFVDDVVEMLMRVSLTGCERIYNIAGGVNVAHREVLNLLQRETGCRVRVEGEHEPRPSLPISIERIRNELGFTPRPALPYIAECLTKMERQQCPA